MYIEIERERGGEIILNADTISEVWVAATSLGTPIRVDVVTLAQQNGGQGPRRITLQGWEAEQLLAALEANLARETRETTR